MVEARALYRIIKAGLEKAGIADAAYEAGLLLQKAAGFSRFDTDPVPEDTQAVLEELARRRAAREPLQYILGEWEFMGLTLAVGPGVLVPRPETEEVCLAAIEILRKTGQKRPRVLDLCAGSGALALGLGQVFLEADITAVELQKGAFGFLQKNCAAHGSRVKPVLADALAFHETLEKESLDLIVSNPPYVTAEEYAALEKELYHEPRAALVAEENGLLFYRRIAHDYKAALKPGGALVFEIGAGQGDALLDIFARNGYRGAAIHKDINGLDRIALADK